MIKFHSFTLPNGLRVVLHQDKSTPLAAVNVLYDVGSKDDGLELSGIAHLMEHLMFCGSENVKDFDSVLQNAGGENNAFTNADITNYYNILPRENLETSMWLESDRMTNLVLSKKILNIQKKVVVEEYKENILDEPYGDIWHHLYPAVFSKHPYQLTTIGDLESINRIKLKNIKNFYTSYYQPSNAILTICGNVETSRAVDLTNEWFGDIPSQDRPLRKRILEPNQKQFRQLKVRNDVTSSMICLAFHSPSRLDPLYHVADLVTDILGNGASSRLHKILVKETRAFTEIDAYCTGALDHGLILIEGRIADNFEAEKAIDLVWEQLNLFQSKGPIETEMQKQKNKYESAVAFGDSNVLNKCMNLAYYEYLGDPDLINTEILLHRKVTAKEIQAISKDIFRKNNCTELIYLPA